MSDISEPGLPTPTSHRPVSRPKVPPFARYKGTSAWKKDRRRAREYARYRAASKHPSHPAAPSP